MSAYTRIAVLATILALMVVTFGAYVRLSHAGLSCPDWPGCYGRVLVPESQEAIARANAAFPQRPVDVARAWLEMIHRYLAGALGLIILGLAVTGWLRRRLPGQLVAIPIGLLALVCFQALLGMWTVTLLLKPLVVTGHLIGGLATLSLLWWLSLRQGRLFLSTGTTTIQLRKEEPFTRSLLLGLVLLVGQLLLGGWTSTNYAALACPDFPTCQGHWLPPLNFQEAFAPWHGLGTNYEGGILANEARVTIHFAHRVGAVVVAAYWIFLSIAILKSEQFELKPAIVLLVVALLIQIALGVSNVIFHLPLLVAVAHNGMAALLLLSALTVYHIARPPKRDGA